MNKYEAGIKASKELLELAKQTGVKILCDAHLYKYFSHNIELWCHWLTQYGVTNILITDDPTIISKDDICITFATSAIICNSKKYIAIQTENLININTNETRYTKVYNSMKNAYVIWDYSHANARSIIKLGLTNIVRIPITYSDNSNITPHPPTTARNIDVLLTINTDRRQHLCDKLQANNIVCLNTWRSEIPSTYNKCKVLLNVHAYEEPSALEIHRLYDFRDLPIVIISEESTDIDGLNEIIYGKYTELCELCVKICTDPTLWKNILDKQLSMWKRITREKIYSALQDCLNQT